MPGWLISLLVSLVFKIGMPLILKRFPWIPTPIQDILADLENDLRNPVKSNSASKKLAMTRIRSHFAAPDLKTED